MLKTTRTRLTVTTLERRETPARLLQVSLAYAEAAIAQVAQPDRLAENATLITLEVKAANAAAMQQASDATCEPMTQTKGHDRETPPIFVKIDPSQILKVELLEGVRDDIPVQRR